MAIVVLAACHETASKALDKMAREKLGVSAREMYATIHVTDFVALHGAVTMQNAADAAAIMEASQGTEAQIQVFAELVKAMMPAGG